MNIFARQSTCTKPVTRCEFESHSWRGVPDTTLCDNFCRWFAAGRWFSPDTPISYTNKTDRHYINEILLNVASNTTTLTLTVNQGRLNNIVGPGQCSALGSLPTQPLRGLNCKWSMKISIYLFYRYFQQNQC